MNKEDTITQLKESIGKGDKKGTVDAVEAALSEGTPALNLINEMTEIMKEVGKRFEDGDAFLPEMIMAADAWKEAVTILEPKLAAGEGVQEKAGRVVIGTVKGDIHDLGKNIVVAFLKTVGFDIMDLGNDVSPSTFIDNAEAFRADIIGMSALLTTTMPYQQSLIEHLEARNLRGKYKVLVGGGPVNQAWADEIGADGYARDAAEAARLCAEIVEM